MSNINLDDLFRRDSAAKVVAERLMTGKARTRQELVEGLHVSVTTVNRVVETLTAAGAHFVRDIADDGRQARFRLVEVRRIKPKFPTLDDEVEIVGAWKVGDATMLELQSEKTRYRGQLKSLSKMIPLGHRGTVQGISSRTPGTADLNIKADSRTLVIEGVQPIAT